MKKPSKQWSRDESLVALHIYLTVPFSHIRETNPDIVELSGKLRTRNPTAMKMKAYNFSSLDDSIRQKGLARASAQDKQIWQEFLDDREGMLEEINAVLEGISSTAVIRESEAEDLPALPSGTTEVAVIGTARRRLGQIYFRKIVMSSYDWCCSVTGLALPRLVEASHIIPWRKDEARRLDPTNGLALNTLMHPAFDKGYMTFDEEWRVCFSAQAKANPDGNRILLAWEGEPLRLPNKFLPCKDAMEWHRMHVFGQDA